MQSRSVTRTLHDRDAVIVPIVQFKLRRSGGDFQPPGFHLSCKFINLGGTIPVGVWEIDLQCRSIVWCIGDIRELSLSDFGLLGWERRNWQSD